MTYLPSPFKLREGEKQVLVTREWLSTVEFSKKHFTLVTGPSKGQNFRHDKIPWAAHIMDMWDRPEVREVIICGTSQVAKTTIAYCCLLANQYRSPAPAGIGMPGKEYLKRILEEKVAKHILNSKMLRSILAPNGVRKDQIQFKASTLYGMFSGSEASMSSTTMRDVGIDEEDAYEPYAVETMLERLISYGDESKALRYSKPRGNEKQSSIWRGLKHDAQVVYQVRAKCPIELCGHMQVMTDKNIVVPRICKNCGWQGFPDAETCPRCSGEMEGIRDPQRILAQDLARYRCEKCGALWNDHMRDLAVRGGDLYTEYPVERPTKVAYHLPSWVSPFVRLSKVMADFFKAHNSGDSKLMRKYDNDHKAMPYKAQSVQTEKDVLRKMIRPEHKPFLVPDGVLALTCGIDMQLDGFWFVVRGWRRTRESFKIAYGWLDAWENVEELLFNTTYAHASRSNIRYPIWRAGIDIGGGKSKEHEGWSKTDEVKDWLVTLPSRGYPDNVVVGIKGASHRQQQTVRASKMQFNPLDSGVGQDKIPLYTLDTDSLKDSMFLSRIGENARQPMWLHSNTGDDYLTQLTNEERVVHENGKVEWVAKGANHLLDCEVYAAACAHPDWMPALVTLDKPHWNVLDIPRPAPTHSNMGNNAFNSRMKRPGRINPNAR